MPRQQAPLQQPNRQLHSARLRLHASAPALAAAVLEFQSRNAARFARWDPPPGPDAWSMSGQQQRMRRDAAAFAAGSSWRWFMLPRDPAEGSADGAPVIGQIHVSQVYRGPLCSAMLGYAIDAEHEGCGLMAEALAALIDELFSPRVNLHRLQANARPDNARSLALLERLGFVREGLARDYLYVDGAWRDHVLSARINPEFIKPPGW